MNEATKKEISIQTIKSFILSWRFWKPALALVIGGIGGFLYYHYIGCNSGQCTITSNPWLSIIWGSLLGIFIVNSPCSRNRC